jgi:hypothetical protein
VQTTVNNVPVRTSYLRTVNVYAVSLSTKRIQVEVAWPEGTFGGSSGVSWKRVCLETYVSSNQ